MGQRELPATERALPPAGRVYCLGKQRSDAGEPSSFLPARSVPVRQSAKPHPCHGEAAPAYERCHPNL